MEDNEYHINVVTIEGNPVPVRYIAHENLEAARVLEYAVNNLKFIHDVIIIFSTVDAPDRPNVAHTPMHNRDIYWFLETARVECLAGDIIEAAQEIAAEMVETEEGPDSA